MIHGFGKYLCSECDMRFDTITQWIEHQGSVHSINKEVLKMTGTAIDTMLAEREATHGDFTNHARITCALKEAMRDTDTFDKLDSVKREALDMIQHKIGRILAGNPNHADHWDDIAGYAQLAADRCGREHA